MAPGSSTPITLFDPGALSNLERASPRVKVIAGANYELNRFSLVARGTVYGKSSQDVSPNGGTYYRQTIGTAFIADLELGYELTDNLNVSIGANNLFNKKAPTIQLLDVVGGVPQPANGGNVYDAPLTFSPYGINGGYYYARLGFDF